MKNKKAIKRQIFSIVQFLNKFINFFDKFIFYTDMDYKNDIKW